MRRGEITSQVASGLFATSRALMSQSDFRFGSKAAVPAPHALSPQDHGKQTIRLRIDRVLSYHGWPFSQIDKIGEPLRFRAIGESDGPQIRGQAASQ
jgi:hypothetical protein